ncbi:MAG: hypothetical protein PHG07_03600 [Lachnospiraceae bacterium]|nr:hypothetical protein [Lachnospiraceae bacterium]
MSTISTAMPQIQGSVFAKEFVFISALGVSSSSIPVKLLVSANGTSSSCTGVNVPSATLRGCPSAVNAAVTSPSVVVTSVTGTASGTAVPSSKVTYSVTVSSTATTSGAGIVGSI